MTLRSLIGNLKCSEELRGLYLEKLREQFRLRPDEQIPKKNLGEVRAAVAAIVAVLPQKSIAA
ncbi:MAG: hypothetical protein RLZZ342_700 [Candidatus Parcubacteria bacterium]|jgi:hypothetical protein